MSTINPALAMINAAEQAICDSGLSQSAIDWRQMRGLVSKALKDVSARRRLDFEEACFAVTSERTSMPTGVQDQRTRAMAMAMRSAK